MAHSIRTRIAVLTLLPFLMGVSLTRCEWEGPSDHFVSLDKNDSGDLSLNEWMEYYGGDEHNHSWSFCYGNRFEHADCDNNRALTWSEYHKNWFRRENCDGQDIWRGLFTGPYSRRPVQMVNGDWDLVKIEKSDMTTYCREITRSAMRHYSEEVSEKIILVAEQNIDRFDFEEGTFHFDCIPYKKVKSLYRSKNGRTDLALHASSTIFVDE